MSTANNIHLFMLVVVLVMISGYSMAKTNECSQKMRSIEYLDEKMVFCVAKEYLRAYKDKADYMDLDGLNSLVVEGKCNFIPDGEYLVLESYQTDMIDETEIIAVSFEDLTIWSFKKFVSSGDPEKPQTDESARLSRLALTNIDQNHSFCAD